MKQQTFGTTVAALRKARGMTQLDLADRMGVTDKAVSKWERDLSFPDTAVSLKKGDFNTLPAIHSIIGNSGFCAILNKKADNT